MFKSRKNHETFDVLLLGDACACCRSIIIESLYIHIKAVPVRICGELAFDDRGLVLLPL
jgi:hypothetical protein